MSFRRTLAIGFVLLALTPAAARADGLLVPFAGVNFGGDAGQTLSDGTDANRFDYGVSFAWMGGGVFGFEGDIGYSPDFYGKTDVGGSSALSLMGNILIGVPFGGQQGFGVRPFGLVGIGMIRSDLESFDDLVGFDNTEVAWDFGGGVLVFFTSHVGLRGDIRYFRSFNAPDFGLDFIDTEDSDAIDYSRASIGLVFRY
jgi:opacity protein-like surface antigen